MEASGYCHVKRFYLTYNREGRRLAKSPSVQSTTGADESRLFLREDCPESIESSHSRFRF